jgi:hypothetical protein
VLLSLCAVKDDIEIAAAVDAEMRERMGQSDDSSDEGDDLSPDREESPSGKDDAGDGSNADPAAAAAKGRKKQQRQSADGDAAGVVAGYSKKRLVRNSVGGKRPEDPLLNFEVSEDALSCNIEVSLCALCCSWDGMVL